MSTYILLRDAPDAKAGTEFELGCNGLVYFNKGRQMFSNGGCVGYSKGKVENNPDWFKKKDETVTVTGFFKHDPIMLFPIVPAYSFIVTLNKNVEELLKTRYEQLCNAIELVVNDYTFEDTVDKITAILKHKGFVINESIIKQK